MATRTETRKISPRQLLLTCGAVVAVRVAVGLGSWQAGLQGQSRGASTAMS